MASVPKKSLLSIARSWNYADAMQQYLVLSSLCQSRECLVQSKGKDGGSYRRRLWYLRWQIIKYYGKNFFNFPIILLKLLTPSFLRGDPNIWVNLKSLATRSEFHPLRMAIISWFVFMYVGIHGAYYMFRNAAPAFTASYTWTQTAWTTSSTDTGVHPGNQTGWVDYSSVDSYITTGATLSMAGLASSITHNDTTDYSGGSYSNTAVGSGGVFMITLGRSSASFSETSVDGAFTSASGVDDVDLDNDGDTDLVGSAYAYGSNQLVKYTNNGSQTFTKSNAATLSQPIKVIGLDVDSDGDGDFATVGEITSVSLYRNNGSGTFTATTMKALDDGYFIDFEMADLDDDGDYDLIGSQDVYQDKLYWVRNTNFSFGSEVIIDETGISGVNGIVIHDIDDDGDKDIAIAATTVGDVIWYANNGSESFSKATIDASLTSASQVVAGDFDGDTDEDVAAIGGSSLVWYANNGSESFSKTTIDSSMTSAVELSASDVDGDGDVDLIAGGSGGLIKWYMNNGSGTFSSVTVDSNMTVSQLSLGDVNSDGATDIIAAGGSSVVWYRQQVAYVASGSYTSAVLDTLENSAYNTVSWSASSSAPTTLSVKVRTSNSSSMTGATAFSSCTAITNGADISSNGCVTDGHRYVQYQLNFTTASETVTPQFNSITINYSPPVQSLVSAPYDTADASNVLNELSWTESLPGGTTDVKFQIRTAPDSGGAPGTWTSWLGPTGTGDYYTDPTGGETINATNGDGVDDQWIQYRVFLSTTNASYVPSVSDVSLTYVVNAPPEFESVSAIQNSNGTVSIAYTVRDPDTTAGSVTPGEVTPSFQYSINNGSTWTNITLGLPTGATSTKAVEEEAYTLYTTTWNAAAQIDGTYASQAKIRVTINDSELANSTASSATAAFALDLKDPVPGATPILITATSSPAQLRLSASDNSSMEMRLSTDSEFTGATWSSYSSTALYSLPSDPTTVYVQFRDVFGNMTSVQSATTPETPSNLIIRDVSNAGSGEYQLFVAWKVVDAPTPGFGSYQIWSSTDGSNYSLLSTAGSRTLNYAVQFSLVQGTRYYYKVATVDASGNTSFFSPVVSDSANGQGGTDATSPTISNVISTPSTQTATITWDTDELANSTVQYSTSPGVFTSELSQTAVADNSEGVGGHSVTLTGLTPGATYYYRVVSTDPTGNTATDSNGGNGYMFDTLSGPQISDVTIQSISNTAATIVWNTDVASESAVTYSLSSDMSDELELSNSSEVTAHSLTLTGLTRGTRYYFSVASGVSIDINGGLYYSFLTTNDTTSPVISSVSSTLAIDTAALVAWTTDEPATSKVSYSTTTGEYGFSTVLDPDLSTTHTVTLSDLERDSTYYYIVSSVDASGNGSTSTEYTFVTLETLSEESDVLARELAAAAAGEAEGAASAGGSSRPPSDTGMPIISQLVEPTLTTTTAMFLWVTDELADTLVQFGPSISYGSLAGTFEQTTNHRVILEDLKPGRTYYYRVTSQDQSGNRTFSSPQSFSMPPDVLAEEEPVTPPEEEDDLTPAEQAIQDEQDEARKEAEEAAKAAENAAEDTELLVAAIERTLDLVNRMAKQISIPLALEKDITNSITELAKSVPPPLLSGRPTLDIGSSDVTISWNTDKDANSMVAYATDADYVSSGGYTQVVGDPESFTLDHSVTILGLTPQTKYHYQIKSKTPASGLTESSDFIFTTKEEQSEIETYTVEVASQTEATFRWNTNVPTDTKISLTPYRDGVLVQEGMRELSDKDMGKEHKMTVTDLEAGVAYDVELSGNDVSGNTVSKVIRGFVTDDTNAAPVISQVQTDSAISPGQEGNIQTVISWVTNEPSTSRVYYQKGFTSSGELKEKTPLDQGYVKKHVVVITSFEPGAVYQFKVESMDASGNPAFSKNFTILTPRQKESVFQVIFRNAEDAFGWVKVFQGQ